MPDNFSKHTSALNSPASGAITITPSDTISLNETTRAIYIGGAGNLTVIMKSGQEVTFSNLLNGNILPIRATQIKATGTTATQLIGLV